VRISIFIHIPSNIYCIIELFHFERLELCTIMTYCLFLVTKVLFYSGGDFLGLVLEFNLPPSSYASMVIRELMKVDNSAVLKKENDHSEHFSQAAIESSDSVQVSRKKQSKMLQSSIVSENTSSSESSRKPREKRFKFN
jgi:hypothetical protein